MATYTGSVIGSTNDAGASLTDTRITVESSSDVGGCRFQNVTVPAGATITSAYVTVEITQASRDEPDLIIYGEDVDDSDTFSSPGDMPVDRTQTTASTAWTSSNLGAPGFFQTPSLVSIVQEIVNRAGWSSGNAMTILFDGQSSTDFAFASVDSGDTPAELTINYTGGGSATHTISVSDYLGAETNKTRQLDWSLNTSATGANAGFADAVSVGVVRMISVADNLGGADSFTTEDFGSSTLEERTLAESAGFADNVLIDVNYKNIFVTDYLGGGTVHGPPDISAPSSNWKFSAEDTIVFGCEAVDKQSHTSGGSTIRFLAGARYRR